MNLLNPSGRGGEAGDVRDESDEDRKSKCIKLTG
jgi:hypothetical protein